MITQGDVAQILESQRKFFSTNKTLDLSFRIRQLKRLKACILRHEAEIETALNKDLGRHTFEGYFCDIGTVILAP